MRLENEDIQKYHRHRYPYILIDSIENVVIGKSARVVKCFSEDEWFFHCHNIDDQPYPFTMIIEILTEAFLMPVLMTDDNKGKITNMISADNAHVYVDIYPGDIMNIDVEVKSFKRGIATGKAIGYIRDHIACEATLSFVIPEILEKFKPPVHKKE